MIRRKTSNKQIICFCKTLYENQNLYYRGIFLVSQTHFVFYFSKIDYVGYTLVLTQQEKKSVKQLLWAFWAEPRGLWFVRISRKLSSLTLSQTSPCFLCVCSTGLLKTLWEKEKLFVMSNFSFFQSVFYSFGDLSAIFIKFEIVVCKVSEFGRVYNVTFGNGLNLFQWQTPTVSLV